MPFLSRPRARSGIVAVIGVCMFLTGAPSAAADAPDCTAADLEGVTSGVSAATSVYLRTHPDVNNFFTGLRGQSHEQIRAKIKDYLTANPDVRSDIEGIRQPLQDFKDQCGGHAISTDTEEGA